MAYDRTREQTIVIGKEFHEMLKNLAEQEDRKLRKTLELIIEKAYMISKEGKPIYPADDPHEPIL